MYPVTYDVEYGDGTRSRGLAVLGILFFLKGLLLIPHFIVLIFLYIGAAIGSFVGYFIILFTGRIPEGLFNFVRGTMAWWTATTAWLYGNTDEYPPFALDPPDTYPSQLTAEYGDGTRSRGLAVLGILFGLKYLLALPHLIIVGVLGYAAGIAAWIGFFIVAFTGSLPEGLHDFLVGVNRWNVRVIAWVASLTDEYPPFSLS